MEQPFSRRFRRGLVFGSRIATTLRYPVRDTSGATARWFQADQTDSLVEPWRPVLRAVSRRQSGRIWPVSQSLVTRQLRR